MTSRCRIDRRYFEGRMDQIRVWWPPCPPGPTYALFLPRCRSSMRLSRVLQPLRLPIPPRPFPAVHAAPRKRDPGPGCDAGRRRSASAGAHVHAVAARRYRGPAGVD
eukprot:659771-Rhodomonas_salina.3